MLSNFHVNNICIRERYLMKLLQKKYHSAVTNKKLVLGCGSNVVDQICKVQAVPKTGEKGFFQSPIKVLEKSVVGGVTLNHLSWASLLGVPTGLLALQGIDKPGRIIRKALKELNINQDFVHVDKCYTTAESYVFVQQDGERSIIMASGATSLITDQAVTKYFENGIKEKASMLTTEISQVPLSGVLKLLSIAKEAGILTVLDFDVSPKVAFNEAQLGNLQQLKRILQLVDVLKPAKHAAHDLLKLIRPDLKENLSPSDIVRYLQEISSSQLVAMTSGSESTYISTNQHLVEIPTEKLDQVIDATGAGDAFLGGLIAGLHYNNGIPNTEEALWELGKLANKTGAANCQVLGGLPEDISRIYLADEIKRYNTNKDQPTQKQPNQQPNSIKLPKVHSKQTNCVSMFEESIKRDVTAVNNVLKCLDHTVVERVINLLHNCKGNVLTSAIGKSGIVANRFAASLSSIGTASHYVHISEWAHGDLGKIHADDIIIFISHSGNTSEVIQAAELIKSKNVPMISLLGNMDSFLGNMCSETSICYGCDEIIEPLGGIPTTSIVLQDAVVNGIICELIQRKQLTKADFLKNHPGGSLGEKFSKDS